MASSMARRVTLLLCMLASIGSHAGGPHVYAVAPPLAKSIRAIVSGYSLRFDAVANRTSSVTLAAKQLKKPTPLMAAAPAGPAWFLDHESHSYAAARALSRLRLVFSLQPASRAPPPAFR